MIRKWKGVYILLTNIQNDFILSVDLLEKVIEEDDTSMDEESRGLKPLLETTFEY